MSITVNTKVYAFDSTQTPDRNRYTGPSHTFTVKDLLDFARVQPKPTGDFRGVARASAKFTRTVTLDDSTKATAIVEVTASLPVGMAEADVDSIRDDMGDLLLLTAADDLFLKQDINA